MIPAGQIWTVVIAAVGLVLTMLNIADKVSTFNARAKEPDRKQDERLTALEAGVARLREDFEGKCSRYDEYFSRDRERLDAIEMNARSANTIIIKSLQALTEHALNGNNVEPLKKSKEELDEYLLNR